MTFEKEVILSWVQDPAEPEMYERPILCPLDKTHLLLVQVWNRTFYFTGRYEGLKYSPRLVGEIDPGGYFYSGETYHDHPNRCLLVGWLMEGRSKEAQLAAGWSGVMSLPRVLTLGDDQTLRYAPVPEVQKLRGANQHIESLRLGPEPVLLNEIKGLFLEISTVITPGSVGEISLLLRASPNLSEVTRLCYDIGGQHLYFDTRQSSQSGEVDRGIRGGTLRLHPGEPLRIRAFQDASVLEVIANERLCLTTRVYPVSENSTRVGFAASGDGTIIQAFDLWEMNC
jgi:beta-fructofuranosidase